MSSCTRIPRRALLALLPALALPAAAQAQCPSAEQVGSTIQAVFKRPGIQVKKVSPAELKGLCEIQVSFQGKPNILYTDAAGEFFVTGHLLDVKGGRDITEENLAALNTIPAEEMKKIDALVAMTVGEKGAPVYFVTDPQ
jgi:thiol:disulfide interchange protein DsbC